jgi:hypothetical protein
MSNWIEQAFTEPQTRFEIAIQFPQGCRKIKAKGNDSGKSFGVYVCFNVEIKYTEPGATWIPLPNIIVSGPIKDSFVKKQTYYGVKSTLVNSGLLQTAYDEAKPFTIRISRETAEVDPELEPDNPEYKYYYASVLSSITGYKDNTKPVTDPNNTQLAKTALSILATKQLNGRIEGINAIVQTHCLDWNDITQQWQLADTNNPASLFIYVLTHPANPQQITLDRIDLPKLQYWHTYCKNHSPSFAYNNVIGNVRSVLEILRDICAAGRASPALIDGKWSVNIDEPKSVVQHFTPHNSWGFESTKALPKVPDALKIKFFNEDPSVGFKEDEKIVYNYGKSEANATLFESITLPGVTNVELVVDHGKWHFAQIKLRPEIYTFNTDIEYLVCNRGDRVKVTHDVPMWGTGSGRIKNRLSSTIFELDEAVEIIATNRYTIRVRSSTGSSTTAEVRIPQFGILSYSSGNGNVILNIGNHVLKVGDTVVVDSNISAINTTTAVITAVTTTTITYQKTAPFAAVGTAASGTVRYGYGYTQYIETLTGLSEAQASPLDLFLFGLLDNEAQDLIVLSVEPTNGAKNARLTLVDYGVTDDYNIFTDYKDLSNATFETQITDTAKIATENSLQDFKPVITSATSDSVGTDPVSPGVFLYGIKVAFTNPQDAPSSAELVQAEIVRSTLSDPIGVVTVPTLASLNNLTIRDVDPGVTYKIRLRYVTPAGVYGLWTSWFNHTVTKKSLYSSNVEELQAFVSEAGIKLTWKTCPDQDYSYTKIRTVDVPQQDPPEYDIALVAWDNEERTTELFKGKADTWTWVRPPSGPHRIMARHYNTSGKGSFLLTEVSVEYVDNPIEVEDLTPPPAPTGLSATASYNTVNLSWTNAVYDTENPIGRGHGGTRIFAAEWPANSAQPSIESAYTIATLVGNFTNYVFTGDPGTRYVFWIREVSKGKGISEGFSGPVDATTGQNVSRLLSTLSAQIKEEHLFNTLLQRINLIDAPNTGLVDKVADLVLTYGNTASSAQNLASGVLAAGQAAQSAALASGSAILAAANALLASGYAATASNSATLASGSAILAAGSAILADGKAILASSGAVSASGSAVVAGTYATSASGSASSSAFSASGSSISASNASGSAASAQGYATVAQTQANFASGSAAAAAFSASGASLSVVTASGAVATASGFAAVAQTQATFASGSAAAAAFSASGAAQSVVTASGAVATASGYLALSQTQANSASGSAAAAALSASGASISVTTASGSAASASGSAVVAQTQANFASGSAAAAAFSASGAATANSEAGISAASASGYAVVAQTQANLASGSASASAFSASGASLSVVTASGAAANASGSAAVAQTRATSASGSAAAAALSASGASVSTASASGSAASASGSAAVAQTQANFASGSAASAAFSASGASESSATAGTASASASGSAAVAITQATLASGSASAAAFSASGASVSAVTASGSSASASGSATLALTRANSASGSASAAAISANGASDSAVTASGSAASASGSAAVALTRANSASGSAAAAGVSASGASVSAITASGSAASAAGSATIASTSASGASGSASAAAVSASGASESYTNASGAAAVASGSAAIATTSASGASGSAVAAGVSASGASVSYINASGASASAAGSAAIATTSASGASGSAVAAGISASGASQSSISASGASASAAGSAAIATTGASGASGSAVAAGISASGASVSSVSASGSAASAAGSVILAQTAASGASGYRAEAFQYSQAASDSSVNASGYAASAVTALTGVTSIASGYNGQVNSDIQQRMIARSSSDGSALGEYSVMVDANGKVAGFGLVASNNPGAAATSTFAIRADKFYVGGTGTASGPLPFVVVASGPNPGTYINTAVIQDASIGSAKIGSVSVGVVNTAVNGGATGARVDIDATSGGRIRIYDSSGSVVRVKLGYLL